MHLVLRLKSKILIALWVLSCALGARPAHAFLNANESSLSQVKSMIAAKSETLTRASAFRVHEYAVLRGTIRAYVSSGGQVFAYTGWHQMGHPPSALLGPYLEEYQAAVRQAHKSGRRALSVNTAHIKAGISGPQGSLSWYLILQNLPAGVSANDVR